MGSDCSLVHCFQYLLACSAGGTSKFAEDGQSCLAFASALAVCGLQV